MRSRRRKAGPNAGTAPPRASRTKGETLMQKAKTEFSLHAFSVRPPGLSAVPNQYYVNNFSALIPADGLEPRARRPLALHLHTPMHTIGPGTALRDSQRYRTRYQTLL